MAEQKRARVFSSKSEFESYSDRLVNELHDTHEEAVNMMSEEGSVSDCAMAAVITTSHGLSAIATSRSISEVVDAINNLNNTVIGIANRIGVKLPSDVSVH